MISVAVNVRIRVVTIDFHVCAWSSLRGAARIVAKHVSREGGPVGGLVGVPVGGVVGKSVGDPVGGEVGGPVDCPVGGEVGTPRG